MNLMQLNAVKKVINSHIIIHAGQTNRLTGSYG